MATRSVTPESSPQFPIRPMKGKTQRSEKQKVKATLQVVKQIVKEMDIRSPRPPSFESLPDHLKKYKHPNWQPGQSGNPLGLRHPNAIARKNERLISKAYRETAAMIHEESGLTMAQL